MRVTILIAFLALVVACKKKVEPRKQVRAPTGFIQEVDGHRAAIIVQGDMTLVIPLDELPPGTVIVEGAVNGRGGTLVKPDSAREIRIGGICPCCNQQCGRSCEPSVIGLGCQPLPSFDQWPGGFGRAGGDPVP